MVGQGLASQSASLESGARGLASEAQGKMASGDVIGEEKRGLAAGAQGKKSSGDVIGEKGMSLVRRGCDR